MDIKKIRNEIDSIDTELTALFEKRMKLSARVAEYKKENNIPVFDSKREREIVNRISESVDEDLKEYSQFLYHSIFDVSRSYQRSLLNSQSKLCSEIDKTIEETPKLRPQSAVVACQGVEGAYSQHACEKIFKNPNIMYFDSFESVFKAVDSGLCRYGVLPLENSTAGSVNRVYSLMSKYEFFITHSTKLFINHALLTKNSQAKIKEVYSHEQAVNQCSEFIAANGFKVNICKNTAEAAKIVAESDRDDIAAIGSKDCCQLYNLKVVDESIQNHQNNYTRFICISKKLEIYPGAKKTSVILTTSNKPGELYNIIARFASLGLNLTKLESRPVAGSDFNFMFYFDIDESVYSPNLRKLIAELENDLESFTYLGSYTED